MSEKSFITENLAQYIEVLPDDFESISVDRRHKLSALAQYILKKYRTGKTINFIFICTHNSRRSHLSQLWAQTAAYYYGIERINCYSGGTEARAFNHRAVAVMKRAGFSIVTEDNNENPRYSVEFSNDAPKITAYSKEYRDEFNPQSGYIAVMTCSEADQNCPVVHGAEQRFSLPFTDPKESDDTPQESESYDLRCRQIASEMFYVFSNIANPTSNNYSNPQ